MTARRAAVPGTTGGRASSSPSSLLIDADVGEVPVWVRVGRAKAGRKAGAKGAGGSNRNTSLAMHEKEFWARMSSVLPEQHHQVRRRRREVRRTSLGFDGTY